MGHTRKPKGKRDGGQISCVPEIRTFLEHEDDPSYRVLVETVFQKGIWETFAYEITDKRTLSDWRNPDAGFKTETVVDYGYEMDYRRSTSPDKALEDHEKCVKSLERQGFKKTGKKATAGFRPAD